MSSVGIVKNNMNIKNITGIGNDRLVDKLRVIFSEIPTFDKPIQRVHYLDQKKDGSCTTFGSAWCLQYNTGKVFENEYLSDWARKHNWDKIWPPWQVAKIFAQEHNAKCIPLNIDSEETQKILEAWYAIAVSTMCPMGFFTAWVTTWKAMGRFTWKTMGHFGYVIKNDRHEYFVNSWGAMVEKGYFNKYSINIQEMILNGYIRPLAYILV